MTTVLEEITQQHARGEFSDEDLSAGRAAIHESLLQIRLALDRAAVTRARVASSVATVKLSMEASAKSPHLQWPHLLHLAIESD